MTEQPHRQIPAGWYQDAQDAAQMRWWDGTQWTAQTISDGTSYSRPSSAAFTALPVAPIVNPATPTAKKPLYKRVWVWIMALLALSGGISAVNGGGNGGVSPIAMETTSTSIRPTTATTAIPTTKSTTTTIPVPTHTVPASVTTTHVPPEASLPQPATSTTAKPVPVPTTTVPTHAASSTTTHVPPSTTAKPVPVPTTVKATPPDWGKVTAGAYCSVQGATGHTSTGKAMVCKSTSTDSRLRWRAA